MNKSIELKDPLYYNDLIYEIKRLAGFDIDNRADAATWRRITERKKEIRIYETFGGDFSIPSEYLSPFKLELLEVIKKISKKANTVIGRYEKISKYPLLVLDELAVLEKKKLENEMLIQLKSVIKHMGLEDRFSLGEDAEQSVCLSKRENLWEVYIVERGITFEKSVFEECYDACLDVINQLADSKQMYEEAKKVFRKQKKLNRQKNIGNK